MVEFHELSGKWQKRWAEEDIFRFDEKSEKPKFYCLEMFPYPSGYGLHMGHARNYSMGDTVARFKRMRGFNVLYPMGYDAFGLPAENAAIKNKTHPAIYTENAMTAFTRQLKELGNSYDWSRTLATCYPEYYKWNQWFFLQFYKRGLAYKKKAPVNWCTKCNTVLANEQVVGGKCWRHEDTAVEQRELEQWFLRITDYADELLEAVKTMEGWPEKIRVMQENWIGKSIGVNIKFGIKDSDETIETFTTRQDTMYGMTFIVMAPEHPKVREWTMGTEREGPVREFLQRVSSLSNIERTAPTKREKRGIFLGKYAIHPLTGQEIPIFAADFVLMGFGTGIVQAVPAHDQRDFDFAKEHKLPIIVSIQPKDSAPLDAAMMTEAFEGYGTLVDSAEFTGLPSEKALEAIADKLESMGAGKRTVNYKIRDWLISRQRYWGTPIPMLYCGGCGIVPVPEEQLPVVLPKDVEFTGQGNPLLTSHDFLHARCPECGGPARRETDTMDTFVDSSWYFLRFCSPHEKDKPFDPQAVNALMPVDQYIGGAEHAVMHLLYARFFTRVLHDMGMVELQEPFAHLFNQGIVYKDGAKMSKSYGNVVSQDEISAKYGIDTARLFLLFVAAPESELEWSDEGAEGAYRFLRRAFALVEELGTRTAGSGEKDELLQSKRHRCVKLVTQYVESFELNKAIIEIMELANTIARNKEELSDAEYRASVSTLAHVLLPFTPHVAEEMHERLGGEGFLSLAAWPLADESLISDRVERDEEYIEEIVSNIRKNLQLKNLESPKRITLYQAQAWKYVFVQHFRTLFASIKNPGQITAELLKVPELAHNKDDVSKLAQAVFKNQKLLPTADRTPEEERALLARTAKTVERVFGCEAVIGDPADPAEPKARNGLPGKPAVVMS